MNDLNYLDYVYASICNTTHFTSRNLNELTKAGVVNNYRELTSLVINNESQSIDLAYLSEDTIIKLFEIDDKKQEIKNNTDRYIELADKNGIFTISSLDDELYPLTWKKLSGMPLVLFGKGKKDILKQVNQHGAVAIVGSRYPSRYSCDVTKEFTEQIADKNVVIVSGLALGIDRIAHLTALNKGKSTVGFVPGGCDIVYPYQNNDIYSRMSENGLILSELPPGTKVIKQYFPSRNRLISGISDSCLIMEAGVSSGTLHTASFAANQSKSVFVLPNSIYCENALGGLLLIKDGARILLNTDDVLSDIAEQVYYRLLTYPELLTKIKQNKVTNSISDKAIRRKNLPELYAKLSSPETLLSIEIKTLIEDILSGKSKCIDDILKELPIGLNRLSALLAEMELDGQIYSDGEKYSLGNI